MVCASRLSRARCDGTTRWWRYSVMSLHVPPLRFLSRILLGQSRRRETQNAYRFHDPDTLAQRIETGFFGLYGARCRHLVLLSYSMSDGINKGAAKCEATDDATLPRVSSDGCTNYGLEMEAMTMTCFDTDSNYVMPEVARRAVARLWLLFPVRHGARCCPRKIKLDL